jgi:hypothetical protein
VGDGLKEGTIFVPAAAGYQVQVISVDKPVAAAKVAA